MGHLTIVTSYEPSRVALVRVFVVVEQVLDCYSRVVCRGSSAVVCLFSL